MTCPMNNAEAADFMNEIGSALGDAGWDIARDIPRMFPTTPVGIELNIPSKDVANPAAESLDDALEAIGLKISNRGVLPGLGTNIRILVGANPKWKR